MQLSTAAQPEPLRVTHGGPVRDGDGLLGACPAQWAARPRRVAVCFFVSSARKLAPVISTNRRPGGQGTTALEPEPAGQPTGGLRCNRTAVRIAVRTPDAARLPWRKAVTAGSESGRRLCRSRPHSKCASARVHDQDSAVAFDRDPTGIIASRARERAELGEDLPNKVWGTTWKGRPRPPQR
jgi:hypothetical protein